MSIKPVSDLYLITYEDGIPYKSTRDAKEAVDAIGAGFKVEEFVSLENYRAAMLQAEPVTTANKLGNSPVIPDTWIPVSERMPETDGNYWGWWSESKRQGPVWFIKSELQAQFQSSEVTHWMPLPAAPQEVKGES